MVNIPGMMRVCAASPRIALANPRDNVQGIELCLREAEKEGASLCVFPELCLTGSTCGDLFFQDALLAAAKDALLDLLSLDVKPAFVVGLPLEMGGRLYNCAAVVCGGEVCLVPKEHTGAGSRYFAPGSSAPDFVRIGGREIPVLQGAQTAIDCGEYVLGVCIGEDLTAPFSPAASLCAGGAALLCNPCAHAETNAAAMKRAQRLAFLSDQLKCAIVHAGTGFGESTTDAVHAGYCAVYEAGDCLKDSCRFSLAHQLAMADVDCARLRHQRLTLGLYAAAPAQAPFFLTAAAPEPAHDGLLRLYAPYPFIARGGVEASLTDTLDIQVQGLLARLMHIRTRKLVIGVSGGLDSTLALLVAARAYHEQEWDTADIIGITMPGFGTSATTKGNADKLMELLGCTRLEIPIGPAVSQHFADIGQDPDKHDICYENSQARERTQILMDYANKVGGVVLGTGDLSELALGFCTYNGDQMSMYNVNGSVPKTLMRKLVPAAAKDFGDAVYKVACGIVDTPVSPELLPGKEEISQKTEEFLGSYQLHDFFLWHMLDSGASPAKLYALAMSEFAVDYDREEILRTLKTFVGRFFTQQFKRSAMPDGPDATGFSLSPRGGFLCPSDAQRALWMAELETIKA